MQGEGDLYIEVGEPDQGGTFTESGLENPTLDPQSDTV